VHVAYILTAKGASTRIIKTVQKVEPYTIMDGQKKYRGTGELYLSVSTIQARASRLHFPHTHEILVILQDLFINKTN
jgi:transposase